MGSTEMKYRNTLMVVLTLSLLLTACSSKSVKLLDQATEQYASGEYSLARENALIIINEYSDSEEIDAAKDILKKSEAQIAIQRKRQF